MWAPQRLDRAALCRRRAYRARGRHVAAMEIVPGAEVYGTEMAALYGGIDRAVPDEHRDA